MDRSFRSSFVRLRALLIFSATGVASACAGANLFQGGSGLGGGPTVDIVAPVEGQEVSIGAGVQVLADISAPDGLTSIALRGTYAETGGAAFTGRTIDYQAPVAASINEIMNAIAGQTVGNVYIVVTATDVLGDSKSDSVKVVIN